MVLGGFLQKCCSRVNKSCWPKCISLSAKSVWACAAGSVSWAFLRRCFVFLCGCVWSCVDLWRLSALCSVWLCVCVRRLDPSNHVWQMHSCACNYLHTADTPLWSSSEQREREIKAEKEEKRSSEIKITFDDFWQWQTFIFWCPYRDTGVCGSCESLLSGCPELTQLQNLSITHIDTLRSHLPHKPSFNCVS